MLANSGEQIAAEKLYSLAKFGPFTTRFKDLCGLFFLIDGCHIDKKKTIFMIGKLIAKSKCGPKDYDSFLNEIKKTFSNQMFAADATKPSNKWFDANYSEISSKIIDFISL